MSKTVKLEDDTYEKLNDFRRKDETRSQAVGRLLNINQALGQLEDILERQTRDRQLRADELQPKE